MTSYANHRRGATSSVKSINLVTVSSTSGSDVRCAMYDSLTDKQISLLNVFHADDGRTEADVFLVFEARANSYAGKVCIETDTPPKLIIERITGIDKRNKSNFFLPINIVDDEEWRETIPKFETWCYGVARYPQVSSDGKSICPELKQESCKQVSELDKFELFSSALVSTLSEYFST